MGLEYTKAWLYAEEKDVKHAKHSNYELILLNCVV